MLSARSADSPLFITAAPSPKYASPGDWKRTTHSPVQRLFHHRLNDRPAIDEQIDLRSTGGAALVPRQAKNDMSPV
ncbi:hypothetical protein QLX08_002854 [Tetragonisca angustula]|uniref:Uncharacterized protein n=1 Tax=Tetragonisca angustula TaxID=166442 RepID=A0AAW1AAZ6_9HYME